jgi:hypothetical protein
MSAPLFDPEKCNVPEVPKLDFDFVSECSIQEPPPPIFDCPSPLVPRDPPPPPCPAFDASVEITWGIDRSSNCVEPKPAGVLTFTRTAVDPCRFFVDLNLNIPIPPVPCPTIDPGSVTLQVGYKDICVDQATGVITVTKDVIPGDCSTQDSCKYKLDLDLQIPIPVPPCPSITGGLVTITAAYNTKNCIAASGAISVTKDVIPPTCDSAPSCRYTLDLDLAIPIPPPPCPEITATGAITINPILLAPTMALTVTPEIIESSCAAPECKFDFDIDIELPPFCPEITATGSVLVSPSVAAPTLVVSVDKDPYACKFGFGIDLELPPPLCPTISATGAVVELSPGATPTLAVSVEKNPYACEFDFDVELGLPPFCPEIKATGAVIVTPYRNDPSMAVTLQKDPSGCKFDLDIELEVPPARPCPDYTGAVVVYTSSAPTGVLTFTRTQPQAPDEPCFYDVDLELGVPACVPEFTTKTSIFCTPGRNDITCTKFAISKQTGCKYEAELNIEVPCVRPCADISGKITLSQTTGLPTGALTVTHTPPAADTAACTYALDLDLALRQGSTLEKGAITAAWTGCTYTPTCDVTIDAPNVNGVQKIHIDVRVPQPPVYTGGTIDLGAYGSGTITVDTKNPCAPVINGAITLTTTTCPT